MNNNKQIKRPAIIVVAILVLILAIFGLYRANQSVKATSQEPIKIGGISALTGVGVAIGDEERKGALLATEEVNASGGVLGHPLKLISEDVSIDKIKTVVSVARKLIDVDKVVTIVGPQWDEPAYPMLPIIEESKIPTVGADSSPMLEAEHNNPYFFATWYDNRVGIRELLRYAQASGLKKIAIIKPISAGFWEYTATIMLNESKNYGVEIVGVYDMGNPLELDFKTAIMKVKAMNPDAVFSVTSDYNQCTFMKQTKQLGLNVPSLGTESSGDPTSLSQCADLMVNRYFSTPAQTESNKAFAERFKARFGAYPKFPSAATSYDAVMIIAAGLKKSNLVGGETLRDAIANTRDLRGVSLDDLTLDSIGFVSTPENAYEIQTVRNGGFVKVSY